MKAIKRENKWINETNRDTGRERKRKREREREGKKESCIYIYMCIYRHFGRDSKDVNKKPFRCQDSMGFARDKATLE